MDTIDLAPHKTRRLPRWLTLGTFGIVLYACMVATFGTGFATRYATHDIVAIWPAAGVAAFMALRFGPIAGLVMFPSFFLQTVSVLGWDWTYVCTSAANTGGTILAAWRYGPAGGEYDSLQGV